MHGNNYFRTKAVLTQIIPELAIYNKQLWHITNTDYT